MNYLDLETEISPETAKQIILELYVYSRLMRNAQRQYLSTRLSCDLNSAKSLESLLDTKLSMVFNILKAHEEPLAKRIEDNLKEINNRHRPKQVDLFKLD